MKTPFFSATSKIVLVFALIITGYFGAQAMRAELQARPRPMSAIDEADIALKVEGNKPRFVGDINGIFIAPQGTTVPEEYVTREDLCGNMPGTPLSLAEAGDLDFELSLPDTYVFQPDDIRTGVSSCGGTVFRAERAYINTSGGEASIGRTRLTMNEMDVSVDRPKAERINGRDVVIIEPLIESGIFQNSYAWFPESFGGTYIYAYDLPRKDFMELVTLVASSTR
jgi:hypothetical protein